MLQRLADVWTRRGAVAWALYPLSLLYRLLWRLRALAYRRGWLRTHHLPVPVVIVGNLIAGGAGKTPTVMATVALLRSQGRTPGIVSRGFGRADSAIREVGAASHATEVGDEPLLLHLRTGAAVMVGRDRAAAARALLQRHPQVDVIVSDDGLQHLALARDASVIVFDERGAGNGWLLPAGPLREPMPRALAPRSLVLYNARSASTHLPGLRAKRRLAGAVALGDWWQGRPADMGTLRSLAGRKPLAAAGTAQPQRFFDMLRDAGLAFEALPLPDHYPFTHLPWPANTADVVVTEKDAVKLPPHHEGLARGATRVWVVALDFVPDPAYGPRLAQLLASSDSTTPMTN